MEKNQTTESISSYLKNIAFFRRIITPRGISNGVVELNGIHYVQSYTSKIALGDTLNIGDKIMVEGEFNAKLVRKDWKYISRHVAQMEKTPYTIYDRGVFTSIISFEEDLKGIVRLETSINFNRRTSGYNYDINSNCNGFLDNNMSGHFVNEDDTYRLHDGVYLIHSNEDNPEFEVYRVPSPFNVADGISELEPKVFIDFKGSIPKTDEERLAYYKKHRK